MTLPAPYFDADGVTLYHGDNREVLPLLGPYDHCLTDPPYLLDYGNCVTRGRRDATARKRDLGYAPFDIEALQTIAPHIAMSVRRWCIVWSDAESTHLWRDALRPFLKFIRTGAWARKNPCPQFTGDRPGTGFEACSILHAPGHRIRWNGGGHAALWQHASEHGTIGGIANDHPTPKPLGLMRDLVRQFTDPGETILDCFGGSGSTAVACRDLGRRCVLIEREEKYCDLIVRRLSQQTLPLTAPAPAKQEALALDTDAEAGNG